MLLSQPSVRAWVDDCTAYVLGSFAAVELAGAEGRTAANMQTMGTRVNVAKSGVVAATTLPTETMRHAAGPLLSCTEPLKYLGVVQGSGAAEGRSATARWSTARERLGKVARFALFNGSIGHLLSGNGLDGRALCDQLPRASGWHHGDHEKMDPACCLARRYGGRPSVTLDGSCPSELILVKVFGKRRPGQLVY